MRNPTKLKGYSYSVETGKSARNSEKLLTLRVETSLLCNMKCIYCAWDSGKALKDEIDFKLLKDFVTEGKELGCKSVVIIGGGEPTIYNYFKELVTYITQLDMIPVVITNGMTMDKELADFLYINNSSVLLKFDSMNPEIQNYLSGIPNAHSRINTAFDYLVKAGFTKRNSDEELRLGFSFVVTSKNISEICKIWTFCRENNIYPNMELLNPIGRSSDNIKDLMPEPVRLNEVMQQIKEVDELKFDIKHSLCSSHANHCLQHIYSLYLNVQGFIQPCGAIRMQKFNYKDMSIKEVLDTSYFKHIRYQETHLDENVELSSFSI